jgi:hypothetical protein
MSDAKLRREIATLFHDWCAVSTDPVAKKYYGWLLEEVEHRRGRAGADSPDSKPRV